MRYEEFLNDLSKNYIEKGFTHVEDMPDVALYMDQLVGIMNAQLEVYHEDDGDLVTKSMISNYVKNKILPKPENKKYSKEHMILLNMLFQLKNVFQMDELKLLFKPFVENYTTVLEEPYDIEKLYSFLVDGREKEAVSIVENIEKEIRNVKKIMDEADTSDDDASEILGVILVLAIQSNAYRLMARKLLAEYFVTEEKKGK